MCPGEPSGFGEVEGYSGEEGRCIMDVPLIFSWIASPSARNDVRGTARNDEKGKTRMTGGERLSINVRGGLR